MQQTFEALRDYEKLAEVLETHNHVLCHDIIYIAPISHIIRFFFTYAIENQINERKVTKKNQSK